VHELIECLRHGGHGKAFSSLPGTFSQSLLKLVVIDKIIERRIKFLCVLRKQETIDIVFEIFNFRTMKLALPGKCWDAVSKSVRYCKSKISGHHDRRTDAQRACEFHIVMRVKYDVRKTVSKTTQFEFLDAMAENKHVHIPVSDLALSCIGNEQIDAFSRYEPPEV